MPDEVPLAAGFLLALATALIATPLAARIACRSGFYDHPRSYKAHAGPTPYLGGAAIAVAFFAGASPVVGEIDGFWAVALGVLVLWLIGTLDDLRTVRPAPRLLLTALAATFLWVAGLGWSLFSSDAVNLFFTCFWMIAIVNAFNLMDNMDGAAAVVASVCASGIGAVALTQGDAEVAALALAMCGACVGFLPYNLSRPARIFMGDGGSMTIGFVVGAAVMAVPLNGGGSSLVPAVLLVALPVLDTALVIVSRYRRRVTIWAGGRDHVTHRLGAKLHSARRVSVLLAAAQGVSCLAALALVEAEGQTVMLTAGVSALLMAAAVIVLERRTWSSGLPGASEAVSDRPERLRILRVITRMNVGGPAYHVALLSGRLDPERFDTLLVSGKVGPGEASFEDLAGQYGARVKVVESLGPEIRPLSDARALVALIRIVWRFKPHIVHTHTAKAGLLGRFAALAAGRPRPIIVHTYHGHVLEGYFGPLQTRLYRFLERALGRVSDCLVGVSQATVDDLVRLRVAPRERFRVVPLGLELNRFLGENDVERQRFRAELGAAPSDVVLAYAGRLVPIKRVDVMLRAFARARDTGLPLRLAIAGDGVLRPQLEQLAEDLELNGAVKFLGYRSDLEAITRGSDIAVLSSDNEGTPVFLIEAAAAGRPAIATAVGGVSEVVAPQSGVLVPPGDDGAFAEAVCRLGANETLRREMGGRTREHVYSKFSSERLLADIAGLYEALLDAQLQPRRTVAEW
jgi:UDP-N-acetylmuramyl pentapeptide phosphotransferase/UDP-N-acetylglucosamine-1-phosphate transferase/glycosyltransferase involved in cell wall biosynthesis